ncbi:MAG: hypothetical protein IBJ09_02700 [Bacteroidia bacterium]|nr:hypothetical protein [Bacteroidia bacterium]
MFIRLMHSTGNKTDVILCYIRCLTALGFFFAKGKDGRRDLHEPQAEKYSPGTKQAAYAGNAAVANGKDVEIMQDI